ACVAKKRALTYVGADKWVPYVEWIGRKPKVDMLRVFGCMCMALVPKHLRHNKLGAKAIWAVHLGMAQNSKGWLLWDPFTKKFLVSRDCKFMENLMYKDWKAENEAKIGMRFGEVKSSGLEHVELPLELSSSSTTTRQSSLVNGGEEAKDAEEEEEEVQQVSERAPTLPSRTTSAPRIRVTPQQRQGLHVPAAEEEGRGKRRIQAPNRLTYDALGKPGKSALAGAALMVGEDEESEYEECAFAFFSPVEMPGEPATLKEALESSDAEEWKKAMESELKSIEENGTWELVELPEGRKAITSKWLFKIKSDADGKIERYKSRLVAKGYQQKERVDYKELFAPVVKPTTLRTLLAGAAIKGWVVKQMDVTTAFLNGVLEEEIFMAQPEGFDDGSARVLRLKKALYGLKQAPRQWYLKLRGVLEEIGFTPSTADHSLFMLGEGEQRSFMVVYVDDILIFSPSSDLVKEVMLKLQDKFNAFKRYKLLKLAMGEEKMPEEGDARDRWIEKSAVLYDLILQSVNNDMFQHIKDLVELDDSRPKAWKLLRDVIQPNTLPMVIVLDKELAALSMQPGDDVKPVLDKIKDTYARMAAAGSNVSQLQQTSGHLSGYGSRFCRRTSAGATRVVVLPTKLLRGMELQEAAGEEGEEEAEAVGEALAEGEARVTTMRGMGALVAGGAPK
ncbi:unnamed protein product, partial [Closterium sp. NIES-53]